MTVKTENIETETGYYDLYERRWIRWMWKKERKWNGEEKNSGCSISGK